MSVQQHQLSTLSLSWPVDWDQVFEVSRPRLIVEIGFGYGEFLFYLAETYPESHIVGVEVANKPIEVVERRIQRRGIPNIRVMYGYAQTCLYHLLQPQSVWQCHINFPDPWFKQSHAQRRLMNRHTLDAVANRLEVGGMFYLATDIHAYAVLSDQLLQETSSLSNGWDQPWHDSREAGVCTRYEMKASHEERRCYYFTYVKNAMPAPAIPIYRELPMPNIVFESQHTLQKIANQLNPSQRFAFSDEGVYMNIMDVYMSDQKVLIEVYIKEPTIEQHVAFVIVAKPDHPHQYTLKLSSLGWPRATIGIHHAIKQIERMIQHDASDYHVIHRKVRE